MTNLFLIYLCLFQCVFSSRFSGFYDVPEIIEEIEEKNDFRSPIIQYVSNNPQNNSQTKNGFLNIMSSRNFESVQPGNFQVQVSSRGNQSFAYQVLFMFTLLHNTMVITNLSLPFKFNDLEYYFGTNQDLSNYSSIPYSLICEYPMARYVPSLYGKFFAIEPSEPVSRVFFGCKSAEENYCCGMECCTNLSFFDILKTCMYFIGVIIFLIVVCQQISLCDKRAKHKCANYETI